MKGQNDIDRQVDVKAGNQYGDFVSLGPTDVFHALPSVSLTDIL